MMVASSPFVPDMPFHIWTAGIVLLVAALALIRAISNRFQGTKPPIFEEFPFIGGLMGFIKSPVDLARRGYIAMGEVRAMDGVGCSWRHAAFNTSNRTGDF
jgi:myosin-crossreactive antigen